MYLCKYDLSKECKGSQRDCVECVIKNIKTEIRARVFDIQATSDKYFDGIDDVMDIVDSVIDQHIGKESHE